MHLPLLTKLAPIAKIKPTTQFTSHIYIYIFTKHLNPASGKQKPPSKAVLLLKIVYILRFMISQRYSICVAYIFDKQLQLTKHIQCIESPCVYIFAHMRYEYNVSCNTRMIRVDILFIVIVLSLANVTPSARITISEQQYVLARRLVSWFTGEHP